MSRHPSAPALALALGLAIITGLSGFVAGCGVGGAIEISTAPMAGKMGGADWTLATAETNAALSSKSTYFFVTGYAETLVPCTSAGSAISGNLLIMNIPKATGDYALNTTLSETFYVANGSYNYVATRGRIVVDEITATTIRGGAHFQFDGDNVVDGQFAAQICAASP